MNYRFLFRVWDRKRKKMHAVAGLNWLVEEISSFKFLDEDREIEIEELNKTDHVIMQCTGSITNDKHPIFEGDVVKLDYQYGDSYCVVKWCPLKHNWVLEPFDGVGPRHKPHFRLAGKRGIYLLGHVFQDKYAEQENRCFAKFLPPS